MSEGKRYFWLKLQDDFFQSKRIKKLRKMAGGDTYTIIYLKMQLLALKTAGIIQYTGLETDFAAELALDLDEEVDDVRVTLVYLQGCGLMETSDDINFFLPYVQECTGSETASAQRVRDYRDRQKSLQCNTAVTEVKRECSVEIEKEIEIDKEIDKNKGRFAAPTVAEVRAYIQEKGYHFDAESFVSFYESKGWKVGNQPMKNWKSACVTWEKRRDPPKAINNKFHNFEERHESLDDDVMAEFNAMMG